MDIGVDDLKDVGMEPTETKAEDNLRVARVDGNRKVLASSRRNDDEVQQVHDQAFCCADS